MGLEIGGNGGVTTGSGLNDIMNLLGGNGANAGALDGNQQGQANGSPEGIAKHLMSLCQQACGGGQQAGAGGAGQQPGAGGGCGGGKGAGGAEGGKGAGGGIQQILEMLMKLLQMLMGGQGAAAGGDAAGGATKPAAAAA